MKIGVFVTAGHPGSDRAYLEAAGRAAEALGFDSLWVAEHVVLFDEYASRYPYAEDGRIPVRRDAGLIAPFTALSFLAAITHKIRLGTGICLVPQRNPLYTAREAADVDWLSGGRLDLGVGVGWLAEEFQALGVPFERRGERCRSYLEVMKRLWCDDVSQYQDEFYTLPACRQFPKPLQKPHPPIHFGGESDVALRRVADIGQGWYGFNLDADGAHRAAGQAAPVSRRARPPPRRDRDQRVAVPTLVRAGDARGLPRRRRAAGDPAGVRPLARRDAAAHGQAGANGTRAGAAGLGSAGAGATA